MRKFLVLSGFLVVSMLAFSGPIQASDAHAQNVAVGVNVINPYVLSISDQEDMLNAIHAAGVSVIRASITLDDKGVDFAERAWKHGIKIEWLIYHFGGYDPFGKNPLSAADPLLFRKTFQPILDRLEAKGITLVAFELGNEINLSGTNPEFIRPQGRARQLSLADLEHDPEGKKIAKGYLQYLKILAVLKDIRDQSKLDQHTPIMTAGLGTYDQDDGVLPGWAKGDIVSINTTLQFMKIHGLDNLVDAYAVHIYPGESPGASVLRKQRIVKYDLAECRPQGDMSGKPCWVTEWGIDNNDQGCPIDKATEPVQIVQEIMGDFRPYAQQGSIDGLMYFAWNGTPPMMSSIWRCGKLTEAGKAAINTDLLR